MSSLLVGILLMGLFVGFVLFIVFIILLARSKEGGARRGMRIAVFAGSTFVVTLALEALEAFLFFTSFFDSYWLDRSVLWPILMGLTPGLVCVAAYFVTKRLVRPIARAGSARAGG